MQTINIEELRNYRVSLIVEYLARLNDNQFEIVIPRIFEDREDKDYSIFWNYHIAAYAGEKLYNAAENFAYYVPYPHNSDSFRFELKTKNIKQLAHALWFILAGCYENDSASMRFNDEAAKYISDAFDGKVNSNTWGLLYIASNHLL